MTLTPDMLNASYEACGGLMLWRNVLAAHRDKEVKGVSVLTVSFFATWGLWNLYYYPFLHQWFSLVGGLTLSVPQCIWLGQLIYYRRRR